MRIPQRVRDIELPQFDLINDLAAEWRAKGADVITLGQAVPGFDPPEVALDALKRALAERRSHIYSGDAGIPELRNALAASLLPFQARIDPEREIIITAGGNQAFQLALTTLIEPGDEVILVSPYFLNHEMAVRSVAAIPIEAPTAPERSFEARWEDIAPHVTPRTSAVVVVSPSNPTGAVIPADEIKRIVAECAARNLLVVMDETYLRFAYDDEPFTVASTDEWRENVVIVGSFSKAFAITGWRCGYLLGNSEVIAEAMKIQDCMVICASVPIQRAVAAVLEHEPDYPLRWHAELRSRRDFVVDALGRIHGVTAIEPSGGFFVMARFDGLTDSRAAALALIEQQQVVTIPGAFFGRAGEGYLRISYGAATHDRLDAACRRIAEFLTTAQVS